MNTGDKSIINRLKRTEGQLRGIQKMVEEGKDCASVIHQMSAVRASIDRMMGIVVAENLKQCLESTEPSDEIKQQKIQEAIQLIVKK